MLKLPSVDTYLSDQEKTWRDIDEDAIDRAEIDHYLAVMDTKPKLFTGEDFLANEFVNPPYLIEPFFPAGGIGIIHGKGGLGKTFLAMTIMRAICLGEPLFGIYPTTQGRVTYIQIDMTARIFQERLLAGGDFYKFEGWNVVVGTPNLMTANRTTPWVQQVHSQRPDLIIIDTLRKAHDMDENVAETPGKFYTKMRELFGATAILPLHHDKKSGDGDPDLAFRGNGAWLFDADVGMHLMKQFGNLRLEWSKVRTCPDQDGMGLELNTDRMSLEPTIKATQASLARADARTFNKENPKATKSEIFNFLINKGYGKSTSSRAKDEAFQW